MEMQLNNLYVTTSKKRNKERIIKILYSSCAKLLFPPPILHPAPPSYFNLQRRHFISFPGQPLLTLAIQSINQSFSKLFIDRKLFTFSGFFRVYPRLRVFKIVRSVFRGSGFLRGLVVRGSGFNLFHNNLDACS